MNYDVEALPGYVREVVSRGWTPCRTCGAMVLWVRTMHDSTMPLSKVRDLDTQKYKSHFVDCPDADKHRKKR